MDVALFGIDNFVSQALSNGLVSLDGTVTRSVGDQVDGLVDSSEGRNVDGLLSDDTSSSDTGGVFSGTSLQNGIDEDFKGVLASKEVNDLESVSHDSDGLDFLSGIAAVELHGAYESFDDGAESFSESFGLISASGVGDEDLGLGGLDCDVIDEAGIFDLSGW